MTLPIFDSGRAAPMSKPHAHATTPPSAATAPPCASRQRSGTGAGQPRRQRRPRSDAQTALEGYRANYSAVEQRYQNGMASLFELEDARRTAWRRSKP
jgi:hypothetical protein